MWPHNNQTEITLSQCIKVNPTWSKGQARKGAALHGLRRYVEAIEAYEAGLKIEDSPALRKGLEEVKAAKGTHYAFACSQVHFTSRVLPSYSGGRTRRWSRGNGPRKYV